MSRDRCEGFALDLVTYQPVEVADVPSARRSFQARGQRGSLDAIAVGVKRLVHLLKNVFLEVTPLPPRWIVVERSEL